MQRPGLTRLTSKQRDLPRDMYGRRDGPECALGDGLMPL